jgi:hypothetical protein
VSHLAVVLARHADWAPFVALAATALLLLAVYHLAHANLGHHPRGVHLVQRLRSTLRRIS